MGLCYSGYVSASFSLLQNDQEELLGKEKGLLLPMVCRLTAKHQDNDSVGQWQQASFWRLSVTIGKDSLLFQAGNL